MYNFPTERNKGIIGTVIFHIALLAILIMSGFHTPLPLPEEEGILVNFGYDETGSGLIEPSAAQSEPAASQSTPAVTTSETAEDIPAVQSTLTQEFEEAPEVVKQVQKPDPEAERKRQQEIEAERIRQQQLEADRIKRAQEEAEQKRLQRERDSIAALEARRTNIFDRTRNALNNANAAGTGTAANQGVAGGTGNQGKETGSVDSNVYGDGSGTGTRGISFNLAGRKPTKLPEPTYDIQSEGIVVVEVTVDRNGNVTNAEPGVKGSTTLEDYFLRVAKEAALAAKFDAKSDAPLFQKGTITYHFKLR